MFNSDPDNIFPSFQKTLKLFDYELEETPTIKSRDSNALKYHINYILRQTTKISNGSRRKQLRQERWCTITIVENEMALTPGDIVGQRKRRQEELD